MKKLLIILFLLTSCAPKAVPTIESEVKKAEEKKHNRDRMKFVAFCACFIYVCAQLQEQER